MARSKTSAAWLNEHVHDHWVHMAQKEGYRSRAAYKLLEIHDKDKLLRPGMTVADLGSAPGSWSQVAAGIVGDSGRVFALDLLEMAAIPGVDFIQGDFREDAVLAQLEAVLQGRPVDVVVSDMAPNLSGHSSTDAARVGHLIELAIDFASRHLRPGGALVTKVFHGPGYDALVQLFRAHFAQVKPLKPLSSRAKSTETFLIGRTLKHPMR